MSTPVVLLLAMVLDALAGEPRWLWSRLPHPAVLMGRAIAWCDTRFNDEAPSRAPGIAVIAGLVLVAGVLGLLLSQLGGIITALIAAILIAQRSLVDHVAAVARGLRMSLPEGRRQVAMIVGRDTSGMDAPAVARGAIESAAENLSDGVIAPVFWFLVAGLPGLMIYKIVNTADSMIGYRTPKHAQFGWASARFDDLLNLIPARLTALLIWAVTARPNPRLILREAPLHRSPNAGWPEAAMAHGLGIALSGPRSYDGLMQDFPFVNGDGARNLGADDIDRAIGVLWKTWGVALVFALALALL